MTDAILVLNAGSSSLKFSLFEVAGEEPVLVQRGQLDGLTTKEAGRLLGVRENTVKTRLHRAKAQLRSALTEPQEGWR